MPTDPKLVRDHFLAAAELAAAQREAYLAAQCGGDAELRAAVKRLLAAHDQPASVLDRPGLEQTGAHIPREQVGTIIAGRYKLLEEIGEGGMGAVWVAEQTQPVRRKVALKLIKAGMDSKSVLARFEAERQALAVMDHPNIAKVHDGGLTEAGRPFFVMEYVRGVPITEYCDATRLSVPERLNLFVQVCSAVQHAHQKGIIHRDLKPSNILVAPYDDKPVPKVIDFGLAKAMHQSLTERTLHTAHETVLGTPLYMSPEQAQLNNLDVDTRSDIYSLGVLLYELLTGTTPLEKKRFAKAAWDEIKRIIREEEPPRPSTRLSSTSTLPSLAAGRQTEPARLTKLVRGELDWIVMKSLEKDRARRYETANGFALDIQRYLAGEPVSAAPPGARYRLRKFARKHRTALTMAVAITILLVAGAAVSTWQAVRATRAEAAALSARDAEAAERRQAEEQRDRALRAEKQAMELQSAGLKLLRFFRDQVLGTARPKGQKGGLGPNVTIREALEAAEPHVTEVFSDQPWAEASLRCVFGQTYGYLGKWELAARQYARALERSSAWFGSDDPFTLEMMDSLAEAYRAVGKLDKAVPLLEQALPKMQAKLGPDHETTLQIMVNLAVAYREAGKDDLALPLLQEAAAAIEKQRYQHPFADLCVNNLIDCHERLNQLDQAEAWRRKWLAVVKERSGADSLLYAGELAVLGLNLLQQKKWTDAEPLLRECLLIRAKTQPDDWRTFNTKSMLGGALLGQKKYADAEPQLRAGYEGMKKREATIPPQGKVRIPEAIDRLIELSTATNKPDEVKKWRKELDTIKSVRKKTEKQS
jgi:tetratricopeptide (TPR) repeat protein